MADSASQPKAAELRPTRRRAQLGGFRLRGRIQVPMRTKLGVPIHEPLAAPDLCVDRPDIVCLTPHAHKREPRSARRPWREHPLELCCAPCPYSHLSWLPSPPPRAPLCAQQQSALRTPRRPSGHRRPPAPCDGAVHEQPAREPSVSAHHCATDATQQPVGRRDACVVWRYQLAYAPAHVCMGASAIGFGTRRRRADKLKLCDATRFLTSQLTRPFDPDFKRQRQVEPSQVRSQADRRRLTGRRHGGVAHETERIALLQEHAAASARSIKLWPEFPHTLQLAEALQPLLQL